MGIREQKPRASQTIHIGCHGLVISTHAANPVIQIVNCYEKDVGLLGCCSVPSSHWYEAQPYMQNGYPK